MLFTVVEIEHWKSMSAQALALEEEELDFHTSTLLPYSRHCCKSFFLYVLSIVIL